MPVAILPAAPGADTASLVRFAGVQKTYDGVQLVVRQLDLDIRRGEFLTLLGPSGSGKTTTLMMLAGFESPTAGEILLDGRPITRTPPHKRNFGMVFQNYALFPHLTVRANVAFGLKMRGVGKAEIERRVAEVLRLVRLTEHAAKHPAQLSGGQQQRVAIARAIVTEPALVLMDEPLSNLDAALRLAMRGEIRRIHQDFGLTTVYVTHDQEEALSLADRLVVLHDGRVSQIGTPAELYEHPADPHVAAFMGYRNLLPLTVTSADAATVLAEGDGLRIVGTPAAEPPHPGDQALVAIRPEDLHVAAEGETSVGEATAEIVEYHGRVLHVEAATSEGRRLHLKAHEPVRPGDRLRVAVAAERALVFRDAAAEAVEAALAPEVETGATAVAAQGDSGAEAS